MDGKQGSDASSSNKEDDSPPQQGASSRSPPSSTSALGMPSGRLPPFVGISGVAPSPPQFVTMEEIMSAANGLSNMRLFHEIAVDKDFKLTPYDPPQNSIERAVKDAAHRAFWDLLSEELQEDPPVYTRAMILLEEVKAILLELVLPQQEKMIQEINEMIDVPFIRQQAENGALDFLGYAQHIINVMGRICAPARDENIEKLKEISDPIDIFKGVFETLTLMRLDFANFGIQMLRTNLLSESVEYEKTKFAKALALQGGIDSLVNTKKWLKRHFEKTPNGTEKEIVLNAYLEMFSWGLPEEFPETVVMDSLRHRELGQRLHQLVIMGSVLLVTLSRAALPALQQSASFKEKLLNDVNIVLQDVKDDEALKNILPSVAVQVISILKTYTNQGTESNQVQQTVLVDAAFEQSLSELIQDIHKPDHNVRRIVNERTIEFVYQSLASLPNVPKQVPPGMTSLRSELLSITASIIRLYEYNLAVFGDYYSQIISKLKEENAMA